MNISPQMTSHIQGFSSNEELKWRAWNGAIVDLWDVSCAAEAQGHYISPLPRLFISLELEGDGGFVLGPPGETPAGRHERPFCMSYIPAGMPIHGRADGLRRIKHLDLHFDETALARRMGKALDQSLVKLPRLQFHDDRMAALAGLLCAELTAPNPMHDLYGEGLLNALFVQLFEVRQEYRRRRPALSSQKLKRIVTYIDEHCLEQIRLGDLAALVGLSESPFSHAFKAATGVPPHRWQTQARIRRTQELLKTRAPLTSVALAAGFADQAHFTRVFKSVVGVTPAAWLRDA